MTKVSFSTKFCAWFCFVNDLCSKISIYEWTYTQQIPISLQNIKDCCNSRRKDDSKKEANNGCKCDKIANGGTQ